MTSHWLYDAIMYIYALALFSFFADFLERSMNARRMGMGLLVIVWLLQAGFFFTRMFENEHVPLITMFETLFFFSWVVVTLSLVLQILLKQELVMMLLGILGFLLVVCALFGDTSMSQIRNGWDFGSQLLLVHISLGIASYSLFVISAVFSGIYLFLHNMLKGKKWSANLSRLPSLDRTAVYAYRSVLVGCVLLLCSLSLGMAWIVWKGDLSLLFDPKMLTYMLLICAYFLYIVLRSWKKTSEYKLAWWNLGSCGIIVLNFVVSKYLSHFHPWDWM